MRKTCQNGIPNRRRLDPLFLLCGAMLMIGCAPKMQMEAVKFAGFDACRLSNGTVDVVVVPSIGRIVRYGWVGGENVLWTDLNAIQPGHPKGGWLNWGGDKIWLWPQADWATRTRTPWPPPMDSGPQMQEVRFDGHRLELRSPRLRGYPACIVREIELEPSGSTLHLRTRLEPVDGQPPLSVVLWQVTQIRVPEGIEAHLTTGEAPAVLHPFERSVPWTRYTQQGDRLALVRTADEQIKSGLDADAFSARWADTVFTTHLSADTHSGGTYLPGERAQIYSEPDSAPNQPDLAGPYVEFEFTAPRKTDGHAELDVTWTLHRDGDPAKPMVP